MLQNALHMRENCVPVWNIDSTINGTLHRSKYTSTSACFRESDIQVATESVRASFNWFNWEFLSSYFRTSFVQTIKSQFFQQLEYELSLLRLIKSFNTIVSNTYSTSDQESGTIGGSVVGETNFDAILRQFATVCCAYNDVSYNSGISDLKIGENEYMNL